MLLNFIFVRLHNPTWANELIAEKHKKTYASMTGMRFQAELPKSPTKSLKHSKSAGGRRGRVAQDPAAKGKAERDAERASWSSSHLADSPPRTNIKPWWEELVNLDAT